MKKLVLIGAILYCIAPDLLGGPADDLIVLLSSMAYTAATAKKDRDPAYVKMDKDF